MSSARQRRAAAMRPLRRVLILADESANWRVAGLRQLDRLALCLEEFARVEEQPVSICVAWKRSTLPNERWQPENDRFARLQFLTGEDSLADEHRFDLVLSTRLFLYRRSVALLRAALPNDTSVEPSWEARFQIFHRRIGGRANRKIKHAPWHYLTSRSEIAACERRFLADSGKSQDGLVSRYLNRPVSRAVSRWLLKTPLLPTTWSLSIFVLPLLACVAFVRGNTIGFIIGCAIFQIYSILDGCDGEIARATFQQSETGRRLDSLCDLIGSVLLAFCLGIGLARQTFATNGTHWLAYAIEGVIAACLILLSEGIVFLRRGRPEMQQPSTKWNGALYPRHHELIERSGLLLLGEKFAWCIVQLTKRDMAMLGFLGLAILGWAEWILHLQILVAGISSVLAANAFLRPAPAVRSEEAG